MFPQGFVCLICGPTSCSHQLSVSAGTMMEGTHLALREWFVAMWFMSSQKGRDQRQAGYSYKTAGYVLVRIRCAIARLKCLQRPFC